MLLLSRRKNNIPAASQLQSVLAEFSRLLSTYIVFSGRASFNWAVNCPGLVLFLTGPAHDDNGAQWSSGYLLASGPPALVIFCLTTSAGTFFYWIKHTAHFNFPLETHVLHPFSISTYSFTSSYTRIIILKIHKIHFSYLHPYFCCWFFYHWFSLKPTQLSHVLFVYKNKTIFWQINRFLKKCLSFRDYKSSDSTEICKIRLNFLTVVLGRKWAVINYLRISKWVANYLKNSKWALCCLPQIWRLTCGPTKFMHTQGLPKKKLSQQSTLPASDR